MNDKKHHDKMMAEYRRHFHMGKAFFKQGITKNKKIINRLKYDPGRAQFCRDSLDDISFGITAGMVSSVSAFILIPLDLFE
ncbi:MAG: hypothetical protein GY860_23705 [Desulfobacteraceae bacterium]|nr:hypothetical protein [Desulfobacteraceae bacterium]